MARILFVCTANICRSPAAEAIARSRYGAAHEYESAGFLFDDRPIDDQMARALDAIGIRTSEHRSRVLKPEILASADLILTMEARHVQDIAVKEPDVFARTLPLTEAAERLVAGRRDVESFVAGLADREPLNYLDSRWDIEDPYKRSRRKYRKSVEEISTLIDRTVAALS